MPRVVGEIEGGRRRREEGLAARFCTQPR